MSATARDKPLSFNIPTARSMTARSRSGWKISIPCAFL